MRRWFVRLAVVLFTAIMGYMLGRAILGPRHAERVVLEASRSRPPSLTQLLSVRSREHPHGLDADDSPAWSPKWGTAWKGGGRHPVWRGCARVYDPELTAFLNTPASVDMTSGP